MVRWSAANINTQSGPVDMNRYVVIAATILVASPSFAQRGGFNRESSSGDLWKFLSGKYDQNGDGKITVKEYGRGADKFKAYDSDGDGSITQKDSGGGASNQRRGGGGGMRGAGGGGRGAPTSTVDNDIAVMIAKNADDNEDGSVSKLEWSKALTTLDHNQDKVASASELNDIMCAALGRNKLSDRAVGRRSRHLDTNKDGKVQLAELDSMFSKLDKNSDKAISKTELNSKSKTRPAAKAKLGQTAPDFELPFVNDSTKTVRLSSFAGKKPVALIFGSYT
jgi:Ca2+-binding EF-hand superfamily protein